MHFIAGKDRDTPFKLEYEIYGDHSGKEKLIFLTGVVGSMSSWKNHINYITKNFPQYQIACIHYRGLGKSEFHPSEGVRNLSLDLLGLINHLKWSKVHLISTSLGSLVSYDFALHSPHRVKSLLLSAMKPPNSKYTAEVSTLKESVVSKNNDLFLDLLFSKDFLNSHTDDGSTIKNKLLKPVEKNLNDLSLKSNSIINDQFHCVESYLTKSDDEINLKERNFPISLICGANDIVYPMKDSFQLLDFIKPDSFSIFNGCGHGIPNERINDFNIELNKTLKMKRDFNNTEIKIYKNIFNNNSNETDNYSFKLSQNKSLSNSLNNVFKTIGYSPHIDKYSRIVLNTIKKFKRI